MPVKKAPEGTELARVEKIKTALAKQIKVVGEKLGLTKRDALRESPKGLELKTEEQRKLNNRRLQLLDRYERVSAQMVMPVRKEEVSLREKPGSDAKEVIAEMATRVLPRQYAVAKNNAEVVRTLLKEGKKRKKEIAELQPFAKAFGVDISSGLLSPEARKALEKTRAELNEKIAKLEKQAEKYGVDLFSRAAPQKTAAAQVKAIKEMKAAIRREGITPTARAGELRARLPEEVKAARKAKSGEPKPKIDAEIGRAHV